MTGKHWNRVRDKLIASGWTAKRVNGIDALGSPHEALSVMADQVDDESRRKSLVEVLRLKIYGLEHKPPSGTPAGWAEDTLADFRQLHHELKAIDGE